MQTMQAQEKSLFTVHYTLGSETESPELWHHYKLDVGKVFDVLVEGFSKRSREQLMGRNEQNKAVVFNKDGHHIGETVRVKITESSSATLKGIILDEGGRRKDEGE